MLASYERWFETGRIITHAALTYATMDKLFRRGKVTPDRAARLGVRFASGPGSVCASLFPEYKP
jgi:hypothetical protein